MLKFSASLLAAAMIFAPASFADTGTKITVELSYDTAALTDDSGARSVLRSLRAQARKACAIPATLYSPSHVDHSCVDEVVTEAVSEIVSIRQAAGLDTAAPMLARAPRQVASLEQR